MARTQKNKVSCLQHLEMLATGPTQHSATGADLAVALSTGYQCSLGTPQGLAGTATSQAAAYLQCFHPAASRPVHSERTGISMETVWVAKATCSQLHKLPAIHTPCCWHTCTWTWT